MRFFVLHPRIGAEAETEYEPIAPRLGEAPLCPRCGAFIGLKPWLGPRQARLHVHGSRPGDIAFGTSNDLLLSEALVRAWRKEGLAGLGEPEAVVLRSVLPTRFATGLGSYFHTAPARGASIDAAESRILRSVPSSCALCGGPELVTAIARLRLAEGSWTGEDLFLPWGLNGWTFVTERVLDLAARHGLANVTTTPLEEFRWDPHGPARLP
jgi:hypothetical protein